MLIIVSLADINIFQPIKIFFFLFSESFEFKFIFLSRPFEQARRSSSEELKGLGAIDRFALFQFFFS